jgi:hypothetical protein
VLGFYYAAQRHVPLTGHSRDRESFIALKKVVALALLVAFGVLAIRTGLHENVHFFESFYTALVFADILLVLLSLRYSSAYHVVFRNSGLAVATVLLRLGLSAPAYYNAALGLASAGGLVFHRWCIHTHSAGCRRIARSCTAAHSAVSRTTSASRSGAAAS